MAVTDLVDTALDRSVALGYTRIGPALRRRWWPVDPAPGSMAGRRVLVTGATSGIGLAAAGRLLDLGATVHVLGHDEDHLREACDSLRRRTAAGGTGEAVAERCDISDLADVRRFCDDLAGRVEHLHGLAHVAGTMAEERTETAEGHEQTLANHVLGPHLMTARLAPLLRSADGASVVFMSSGGMYGAALRADDPEYREDGYSGTKAYARTKRMQVVLAQQWADRLEADGVRVEAMHPGWVDTKGVRDFLPKFRALTLPFMRDPDSGADTLVWLLATRPDSRGTTHFWHDRRPRTTSYGRSRQDDRGAAELWRYVCEATGVPVVG